MSPIVLWKSLVAAVRFVVEVVAETRELRRKLGRTHYSFES